MSRFISIGAIVALALGATPIMAETQTVINLSPPWSGYVFATTSGTSPHECSATASLSTFARAASAGTTTSDAEISLQGVHGNAQQQLSGMGYLKFNDVAAADQPATTGVITFDFSVGNFAKTFFFTGYSEKMISGELNVGFNIVFPNFCTLPMKAVYRTFLLTHSP